MNKTYLTQFKNRQFPVFIEKDEDGFYVVECPTFQGCYSQGKTLDNALKNIKEVIKICLAEKENQEIIKSYVPAELSLHTVSLA
ncbi:type II toxin-antitoxin system HicB family antitoxin [Patescibacteria group bacterium]|nr:type II toxin-antitoxin system HicB family antitoxin [Patescibacteria group bacterium]